MMRHYTSTDFLVRRTMRIIVASLFIVVSVAFTTYVVLNEIWPVIVKNGPHW